MSKKNALGKGIGALLSDAPNMHKPIHRPPVKTGIELELYKIKANPGQPRTKFDEESLAELAQSITQLGIIQPITVREIGNDSYEIISGERRFRASQLAGLKTIPAYIRTVEQSDVLAMALVENVQREDLDAIEIATSYQRLIDECNLTQEQLSLRVGKQRSTITNYLRLLKLPPEIQLGVINEDISMGHARALVSIEDNDLQVQIFTKIIESDLSVREVESIIRDYKSAKANPELFPKKPKLDEAFKVLQDDLSDLFKSKVNFTMSSQGSGKISIPFSSEADLERLLGIFDKIKK